MICKHWMRIVLAVFLLFSNFVSPVKAATAQTKHAVEKPDLFLKREVTVKGFRSAHFGMNEAQLYAAILKDFKIVKEKVQRGRNPTEKTATFSIMVKNLMPETGMAKLVYIMGYKSKKLIQVNVSWGHPIEEQANAEELVNTANILRSHFAEKGFEADKVLVNTRLNDSTILVFRGEDSKGRMVLVTMTNPPANMEKGGANVKKGKYNSKISLVISYMARPKSPDIFKLKSEDF